MPNRDRTKVYWDACVWLSYVNEDADRIPVLDAILANSADEDGSLTLHTSELSQVEVAFAAAEQKQRLLDPEVETKIDSLWIDRDAVVPVEYHERIGREARELMRFAITNGWSLKPMDAIHLATAKWLGVSEFHTYDTALNRYSAQVSFKIMEPYTPQPRLFDEDDPST